MDKIEDYLQRQGSGKEQDDYLDCAMNILKNLHRQSQNKENVKSYIPRIVELIDSYQGTGGSLA